MKLALAQINATVGDIGGNLDLCLRAIDEASAQGADLIVLPEMAIPGYPPRDILLDVSFVAAVRAATADLARLTADDPPVLVGSLWPAEQTLPRHPSLYNAAVLLQNGAVSLAAAKRLLPAYDVFHEPRWFLPGPPSLPLEIAGERIGVLLCEDLWDESYRLHPSADLLKAGATSLICMSASPFRHNVMAQRLLHAQRPGRARCLH